jgi:hypothetical protein
MNTYTVIVEVKMEVNAEDEKSAEKVVDNIFNNHLLEQVLPDGYSYETTDLLEKRSLAQVAYEAYVYCEDKKAMLPPWKSLNPEMKFTWGKIAVAVIDAAEDDDEDY